ncbi:MAG: adenylosuccinate lyase [Firmicutes bacterium]|jgi:adenylosuccinate lyase|nr:adenylosuccinate lyase [Bacillota bacterium]
MIDRYTYPEMARIWTEENKMKQWLKVEVLACAAMSELGEIPREAVAVIQERAGFDVERVKEIERVTRHDVAAFVECVAERIGEEGKYIHRGLTSSDVLDTGLALQMKEAGELLLADVERLQDVLKEKAVEHKDTVMIGRTHGVHAEPITWGLKLLLWFAEMERARERLARAVETVSVGKISGAVGTYANVDPRVEAYVCEHLGLKPAPVSTQILQRDRHAEYLMSLALAGSSLEKFATEIRGLQRTEVLEVEESFHKGQKGSSAMPHKRNPVNCERIAGLARLLRGNAHAAMDNVNLWHERDISHSSVERVIIPDSTLILDFMLRQFTTIMENLIVYPEHMRANLERTGGLVYSQRLLLALIDKGVSRSDAYEWVQEQAMATWHEGGSFKERVLVDERILAYLTPAEIDGLFDYRYHLRHVDEIYARFGL